KAPISQCAKGGCTSFSLTPLRPSRRERTNARSETPFRTFSSAGRRITSTPTFSRFANSSRLSTARTFICTGHPLSSNGRPARRRPQNPAHQGQQGRRVQQHPKHKRQQRRLPRVVWRISTNSAPRCSSNQLRSCGHGRSFFLTADSSFFKVLLERGRHFWRASSHWQLPAMNGALS